MPTATTKKTYSVKKGSAPKASAYPNHPSWADMIRECIAAHPTEARSGVSRPTIKKYVELKYNIKIDATAASQLNRAIAHGSEKGTFVLPKGPSGKVKLPPKSRPKHSKENIEAAPAKKPSKVASKATTTKPKPKTVSKPSAVAKKATAPKAVKKRAAPARPASSTRPAPSTTRPASSATKSRPRRKPATKSSPKKSKAEAVKKAAKKASTTKNTSEVQDRWDEDDVMLFFWGNSKAALERHAQKKQERTVYLEDWRATVMGDP